MRYKQQKTKWRLLGLLTVLIAVLVVGLTIPAQAQGTVQFVLNPSATMVEPGETFTVTVEVQAGTTEVDLAEVHLDFDPAVVTVNTLTPQASTLLPIEFVAPTFDNTAGTIGYSVGKFTAPFPTGTFDLLTIEFQAVADGTTDLAFAFISPNRNTKITSGGVDVLVTPTDGTITVESSQTATCEPLYRVNVGGNAIAAADDTEPQWSKDTGNFGNSNNSPYLAAMTGGKSIYNGNSGGAHQGSIVMDDPSIPPSAPSGMFNVERYDQGSAPEMLWQFPVDSGTEVEVRLYFAELFGSANTPGFRVFDVSVEGNIPSSFTDIDPFKHAGPKGAFMRAAQVTSDGTIDIEFIHKTENPAVKGIEIILLDSPDCAFDATPAVYLQGEENVILAVGDTYSDGGATAHDAEDGDLTASINFNDGGLDTNVADTYTLTYSVTDSDSNQASVTRTVTVLEELNSPPVITQIDDQANFVGDDASGFPFSVEATDEDLDDTLTYSVQGLPDGLNFDTATGDITGALTTFGEFNVTIEVTDSEDTDSTNFVWLVGNNPDSVCVNAGGGQYLATDGTLFGADDHFANGSPFSATGNIANTDDDTLYLTERYNEALQYNIPVAADGNYDVVLYFAEIWNQGVLDARIFDISIEGVTVETDYQIYVAAGNAVKTAVIETYNFDVEGTVDIIFTASENNGKVSAICVNPAEAAPNTAPEITLTGVNPQVIEVFDAYTELGATAFDAEDGDISGDIVIDASAVNTSVLGDYIVTYNVVDSEGLPAPEVTRTVSVVDTTAPVITLTGDNPLILANDATEFVDEDYSASDNYDGDITEDVVVDSSAIVFGTPGDYTVTYDVSDSSNNEAEQQTRTVTVQAAENTAPEITLTGANPQVIEVFDAYTELGATAFDAEDGDISGDIEIDDDAVDTSVLGDYIVTYNVVDSEGLPAPEVTRTVSVVDTTAPVITLTGDNPLILANDATEFVDEDYSASDNYDGDITEDVVVDSSAIVFGTPGDYTVTYDVSDSSNNAAEQKTRTVTVQAAENTAPEITLTGANPQVIEVFDAYTELGATAFDAEDGDISGDIEIDDDAVDTSVLGDYIVTYNVVDSEGLPAPEVTRTVSVVDTTAPVITLTGDNPLILANDATEFVDEDYSASDNYDGDITEDVVVDSSAIVFGTPGDYTVTYNVSDSSGNAAEQKTRTVTVQAAPDTVDFVLDAQPATVTVGEEVTVTVQVVNTGQPIDLAEIHLNFDPNLLAVTNLVPNTTELPLELVAPAFDNTLGTIDYAGGKTADFPTGSFDLLTITFQALAETDGTDITFNDVFPRQTKATFGGSIILNSTQLASVAIDALPTFTIQATAGNNGSISPSGDVIVSQGSNQLFTFLPDEGFKVDTVLVNGQEVTPTGDSYTIMDVQDNGTIDVSFTVEPVNDVFIEISPATTQATLNEPFTVDVIVNAGAQRLDAAEVHLNFDPNLLEVTNLEPGAALPVQVDGPTEDNTAGTIDYAAGELADHATGSFNLLTITFLPKAETASTSISFADSGFPRESKATFFGVNVLSGTNPGTVTITELTQLAGSVTLQGRPAKPNAAWSVPLTVQFYEPGTTNLVESYNVTTNNDGEFSIIDIAPGTYDIAVKNSHTLQNVSTGVDLTSSSSVDFGELKEGDTNNDNFVTLEDFSILSSTFNLMDGDPGYDDRADFNEDGLVSLEDFSLLRSNFNTKGEEPGE